MINWGFNLELMVKKACVVFCKKISYKEVDFPVMGYHSDIRLYFVMAGTEQEI